jgi:hypothetical protein
VDADGAVRNTYLLQILNKDPSEIPARYDVSVTGLEGAEVLAEPVEIPSTESRTVPLIVRVPASAEVERTTPIEVSVSTGGDRVVLRSTFKSGAAIGSSSP